MNSVALLLAVLLPAADPDQNQRAINRALNDWHQAAAQANEARYFGYLTPDAVFLGTDGHERWTRDEFRQYAHPYFARGKAWSFTPRDRHVTIAPDGRVAWFDEALQTPNMGPCRGSGVLVRDGKAWKITQYNLSVPIPNDLMPRIKKLIEKADKSDKAGLGKRPVRH